MIPFKDNFSVQAELYAKFRPQYPSELFEFLSSLTKEHQLAWDCGTGNGQAAIGLANFYTTIIATDPSDQQIKNCFPHPQIKYRVEKAEDFSATHKSIDLITIANALHWFNFDNFYKVVNQVLKMDGIIAAWAYGIPKVSDEIDAIIRYFHDNMLNDFWVYENRLVENEYKSIPFPFEEISTPIFVSKKAFDLDGYVAYLNTWSATQKYIKKYGINPTIEVLHKLQPVWGERSLKKEVSWKLVLKAGKFIAC